MDASRTYFDILVDEVFRDVADDVRPHLESIRKLVAMQNLPTANETVGVSVTRPKTAALCYDRVWAVTPDIPADIACFTGGRAEQAAIVLSFLLRDLSIMVKQEPLAEEFRRNALEALKDEFRLVSPPSLDGTDWVAKKIAQDLTYIHRLTAVPIYQSCTAKSREYRAGNRNVIISAIEHVPIVREDSLSWEQVREVRNDAVSRRNLRRLTHWLDAEMVGKSNAFVEDEIAIRYEKYDDALRRHGIQTVIGTLAAILDSKVLVGGAAAVAALSHATDPFHALIAGGAILVGRASIHVAQSVIDLKAVPSSYPEIAFFIDIEKRLGSSAA